MCHSRCFLLMLAAFSAFHTLMGCAPLVASAAVGGVAVSAVTESAALPELERITEIRYVYPKSSWLIPKNIVPTETSVDAHLISELVAFYNARTYRWDKLGPMTPRMNHGQPDHELKFFSGDKLVRVVKFEWTGWSTTLDGKTIYRALTASEKQWLDERLAIYLPTRKPATLGG
jgi:hypothetical protein